LNTFIFEEEEKIESSDIFFNNIEAFQKEKKFSSLTLSLVINTSVSKYRMQTRRRQYDDDALLHK